MIRAAKPLSSNQSHLSTYHYPLRSAIRGTNWSDNFRAPTLSMAEPRHPNSHVPKFQQIPEKQHDPEYNFFVLINLSTGAAEVKESELNNSSGVGRQLGGLSGLIELHPNFGPITVIKEYLEAKDPPPTPSLLT